MENLSTTAAAGSSLWALLLATLGSTASQPLGAEAVCTARPPAKYSLTFTGKWSQAAFPKQYPLFRPPAQWSSLLGASHSSDYSMWRKDAYVSNGLRDFAERGEAWALMKELEAAGEKVQSVLAVFSAPAVPPPRPAAQRHGPEVHRAGAPAPGNPTGSHGRERAGGPPETTARQAPPAHNSTPWNAPTPEHTGPWVWTAGTCVREAPGSTKTPWTSTPMTRRPVFIIFIKFKNSDFTFSSTNLATTTQDTVTEITPPSPNHPANSFYYPRLKASPHKATGTQVKYLTSRDNEIVDSLSGNVQATSTLRTAEEQTPEQRKGGRRTREDRGKDKGHRCRQHNQESSVPTTATLERSHSQACPDHMGQEALCTAQRDGTPPAKTHETRLTLHSPYKDADSPATPKTAAP
ncbi:Hypothetical predicted protein [Marmota monax]|nr:Hypothetical predicted protein [Marmota monax]